MKKFEEIINDQLSQLGYDPDSVKKKSIKILELFRTANKKFMKSKNPPNLASLKNLKSLEKHKGVVIGETDFWYLSVVNDTMEQFLTYPFKNKFELKTLYKILELYYINNDNITHEKISSMLELSLNNSQYYKLFEKAKLQFAFIMWSKTIESYKENGIYLIFDVKYSETSLTNEYYDYTFKCQLKKVNIKLINTKKISAQ